MKSNSFSTQQKGFSLLEILVAFSILALALGILLKIFSSGVRTAIIAEEYTAAVQIAESLLAKTGVETELEEGTEQGIENEQYNWTVATQKFAIEEDDTYQSKSNSELMQIIVTVNWQESELADPREVELNTLRLINVK